MRNARSTLTHIVRIATLVVPTLLAWEAAVEAPHRDELTRAVTRVLGPVWGILAVSVVLRAASLFFQKRREPTLKILPRLDVLTGTGSWLVWLSAFAVMGAVRVGWASLAAIGLLGGALVHLCVLYAFFALRRDPLGTGKLTRALTPAMPIEGDDVNEEITIENAKIPLGYRLYVQSRIAPRWATARHLLDASDSGSTVSFESEIGPAIRGDHEAEPVAIWLEDMFGLTRSHEQTTGEIPVTVRPKVRGVDKTMLPLLARGLGERIAKRTNRLPTEGNLDLREYRDGDDVRRIHWIRSLAANQLVVRMPDEIPPDRPKVRVILDTYFPDAFALETDTPNEILDAMVAVWLGVGRALAERGTMVTLVAAMAEKNEQVAPRRLVLSPREQSAALALGARVAWQGKLQVDDIWTDEPTYIVSHGIHLVPPDDKFRWIIVIPGELSTPRYTLPNAARTPFPLGHRENRLGHRTRLARELGRARVDQTKALRTMQTNVCAPPAGTLLAVALHDAIRLEVIK